MSKHLCTKIRQALKNSNVRSVIGQTDCTVVLHWLTEKGNYNVFVANRVKKILEKELTEQRQTPTKQNPADIWSKGCNIGKLPESLLKGQNWLCNSSEQPEQFYKGLTSEPQQQTKIASKLVVNTIEKNNNLDKLLEKFKSCKVLKVSNWMHRFINNSKNTKVRGLLTTGGTVKQEKVCIKRETEIQRYRAGK